MTRKLAAGALALVMVIGMVGCAQSVKRQVEVRPPVPPPTPAPEIAVGVLPLAQDFPPSLTHPIKPRIDILIDQVEAAYQAGQQNYRAGQPEKARRDFDRAVDLLLSSGLNFSADPRLEPLLDRIIETEHTYEATAKSEADSFVQPNGQSKEESNTLEEIGQINYPVNPALRATATPELLAVPHDLPLTLNDYVLSYLNFFQTRRGRAIIQTGLRRAGRYSVMIRRVLREEGVPMDLIYLAQAESAFIPRAISRKGAGGIWQFMPFRAQEYGLARNRWVDERLDPERATRAAAQHLRDLYKMFGDWYLAMAAYDSGPLNVARGIQRTGYADFWDLYRLNVLPQETKNYVPIILAMTLVAKDPKLYGIDVSDPDPPLRVDRVKPGRPLDLRLAADLLNLPVDNLRVLNPQLLRLVTPDVPGFELSLPLGTAGRFRAELDSIPVEKRVGWRLHTVTESETLAAIARGHHLTPVALARANDLDTEVRIRPGERLLVPAPLPLERLVRYRVRRGDSLERIASRFDVSVSDLKRWNHLRTDRPPVGESLRVYPGGTEPSPRHTPPIKSRTALRKDQGLKQASVQAPPKESSSVFHQVQAGETLWSIAQAYHTNVQALRSANHFLAERELMAGDKLLIRAGHPNDAPRQISSP